MEYLVPNFQLESNILFKKKNIFVATSVSILVKYF